MEKEQIFPPLVHSPTDHNGEWLQQGEAHAWNLGLHAVQVYGWQKSHEALARSCIISRTED